MEPWGVIRMNYHLVLVNHEPLINSLLLPYSAEIFQNESGLHSGITKRLKDCSIPTQLGNLPESARQLQELRQYILTHCPSVRVTLWVDWGSNATRRQAGQYPPNPKNTKHRLKFRYTRKHPKTSEENPKINF